MKQLSKEIKAYALKNALDFGNVDAGKILPKLFQHGLEKKDIAAVMPEIQKIVTEVNGLSQEQRAREFEKVKSLVKEHEAREKTLNLPQASGKVVTRMPPEPSKYLHVGHALSFLINYRYAKENNGRCILRFDDANPEKVSQTFVDANLEDIREYLGIEPDAIRYVSDDMEQLYRYGEELIARGNAYVCFCERGRMQELRHAGKECACHARATAEHEDAWKKFLAGAFEEGAAVVRFKGDMQSANQVMRDPALFRIVTAKHFRQGTKYKAWPLYDFYSALEDGMLGITHVLRTAEFDLRVELHEALQKLLKLPMPKAIQFGRISVIGAETKGRDIRARIEAGEYTGWDDPRLVTLKALRRRGIQREVLQALVNHVGLSKKQANIDFDMIAALSRKLLDQETARYYFVAEPVKLTITGMPEGLKQVEIKLHPDKDAVRKVAVGKEVFIAQHDYEQFKGTEVRLMSLYNVQLDSKPRCTGVENKRIHKIQWVSTGAVKTKIRMDTGAWIEGLGEPALKKLKVDDIIQFERFGFVRLDKKGSDALEFWFAHK